jgi:hypothetical protein
MKGDGGSAVARRDDSFFGLPEAEKLRIMQAACEDGGVSDFWDLTPSQRRAAYEKGES